MILELDGLPLYNMDETTDEIEDSLLYAFITESTVSFTKQLLKICEDYIGTSRSSNPKQVSKFLNLFGFQIKQGNKWVPFCAAGLSYAACKTYCILHNINFNAENSVEVFKTAKNKVHDEYFLPSASCGFIMQDAQKKGTWVYKHDVTDRSKIQPGWLVLYNWKGGTWPDHIGIVEQAEKNLLHTIEFNTSDKDNINGGAVNRRTRNYNNVLGFVKIV